MNNLPPSITPAPRRVRRKRRQAPTAPVGLTLTAASFGVDSGWFVSLSFDRAIDISAIDTTQIFVNNPDPTGEQWQGMDAGSLIDPQTVRVQMQPVGRSGGEQTTLTASDATGIVASDDPEMTWAGADGTVLPFG